jgi:predicted transcriptional regulator
LEALELDETEEISKVLFELSSNRRANILFEIQKDSLKMQQIAKSLDMTVTETFRHLQRLTEAKLVEKKVDGSYKITSLGKLAGDFLLGFNFVLKNAEYFLDHDVSILPYEFVNRLSELAGGEFCGDTLATLNGVRKIVYDAEKVIWAMGETVESSHVQPTKEKVAKGLEFKFIMPKTLAQQFRKSKEELLMGSRYVERVDFAVLVSEKEANIVFRRNNGSLDYTGFFGTDEKFRKWCRDLFMYFWDKAKNWHPGIQIE